MRLWARLLICLVVAVVAVTIAIFFSARRSLAATAILWWASPDSLRSL